MKIRILNTPPVAQEHAALLPIGSTHETVARPKEWGKRAPNICVMGANNETVGLLNHEFEVVK